MRDFLSFEEAREIARRRLPRGLFDYIDRGVGEEASLRELRVRLDAAQIVPRILCGADAPDTAVELFGERYDTPFIIAPTAMAGLVHLEGEEGLARAAASSGAAFCLSTQSLSSISEIARAVSGIRIWMQIYLWQDLDHSAAMLRNAWDTGARIAVLTVDTPAGSRKEWNLRSGFNMPFRPCLRSLSDIAMRPGWLLNVVARRALQRGLPAMNNYPAGLRPGLFRASGSGLGLMKGLNWDHVRWLRDRWHGKLVLKGILSVEDAEKAIAAGADGIVVSSHGARNFDASPAPIDVLSDIAKLCGGRTTILADSGIRRGLDVLRYRSRGAQAVMLGRLPLWGLAAGGEAGVARALAVLKEEYIEASRYVGSSSFSSG